MCLLSNFHSCYNFIVIGCIVKIYINVLKDQTFKIHIFTPPTNIFDALRGKGRPNFLEKRS